MSDVCFDDDDDDDDDGPGRNEKGQWLPGTSGNPAGRPPKPIVPPKSFAEEVADALLQPVSVKSSNGVSKIVPIKTALIQKLVVSLAGLPPERLIQVLEKLGKFGVFEAVWVKEAEAHDVAREAGDEELRKILREVRKAMDDE
jgi:hypothetical protein